MSLLRNAVLAMLAATAAPTLAAPTAPKGEACAAGAAAIDASVAKTLAQGSPGMLVMAAHQGESIFARAYGIADLEHQVPLMLDGVFSLASVTKQFTAAAILQLVEEDKLDLDEPLSNYVPEFPHGQRITLYQLLVQTSGIPDYAEDEAGSTAKSVARTPQQIVDWIVRLSDKLHFDPGTKWAYSNSNYVLLGFIAERVGGRPLSAMFQDRLFNPAGMHSTAFDDPNDVVRNRVHGYRRAEGSPSGFANADWISPTIPGPAGGLRTTAADLVRWNEALYRGRILRPESLELLTSPGRLSDGRTTKFGMPEAWQKGLNSDYGMGIFVTPTDHGARIWHSGDISGFSAWLARFPESGVTIALLQNSESADMDSDVIAAAIFDLLDNRCPPF